MSSSSSLFYPTMLLWDKCEILKFPTFPLHSIKSSNSLITCVICDLHHIQDKMIVWPSRISGNTVYLGHLPRISSLKLSHSVVGVFTAWLSLSLSLSLSGLPPPLPVSLPSPPSSPRLSPVSPLLSLSLSRLPPPYLSLVSPLPLPVSLPSPPSLSLSRLSPSPPCLSSVSPHCLSPVSLSLSLSRLPPPWSGHRARARCGADQIFEHAVPDGSQYSIITAAWTTTATSPAALDLVMTETISCSHALRRGVLITTSFRLIF